MPTLTVFSRKARVLMHAKYQIIIPRLNKMIDDYSYDTLKMNSKSELLIELDLMGYMIGKYSHRCFLSANDDFEYGRMSTFILKNKNN